VIALPRQALTLSAAVLDTVAAAAPVRCGGVAAEADAANLLQRKLRDSSQSLP